MNKLIAANWKLNPASLAEADVLMRGIRLPASGPTAQGEGAGTEVVILPPFVFLEELVKKFPKVSWGAQDFFQEDLGAYTGEVSLPMIKDVGASWVLVGHSDRRLKFGETDEMVNKKLLAALAEGFNVILAVGEVEKGAEDGVAESLKASTKNVPAEKLGQLNIAYEPVWAISATPGAEEDSPEHSGAVIGRLKNILDVRYLYGGSVDSQNVAGFLAQPNIDGALVGGASLKPDEFSKIINQAK